MFFRYYSDAISNASKGIAKGIFVTGLLVIGFGALIMAFPAVFALVVAGLFIFVGAGCCITAVRMYLGARRFGGKVPGSGEGEDGYRENVQIHIEEYHEE